MITRWTTMPIMIGDRQLTELDVRLDLTYSRMAGWHVDAVLVEALVSKALIRVERDGTVTDGDLREASLAGPLLIAMADHHFDRNREEFLAEHGVTDDA